MFFKLQKGNVEHYYDFTNYSRCLRYVYVCDSMTEESMMLYFEGLYQLIDDVKHGFNIVFRER